MNCWLTINVLFSCIQENIHASMIALFALPFLSHQLHLCSFVHHVLSLNRADHQREDLHHPHCCLVWYYAPPDTLRSSINNTNHLKCWLKKSIGRKHIPASSFLFSSTSEATRLSNYVGRFCSDTLLKGIYPIHVSYTFTTHN